MAVQTHALVVLKINPVSPIGSVVATNFNKLNTDINTVRGKETGYATFNPLDKNGGAALSDGNLKIQTVSNICQIVSISSN